MSESDDDVSESDYYAKRYRAAQRAGIQGRGNALLDRALERARKALRGAGPWHPGGGGHEVLEVGASSGEHLAYVDSSSFDRWTCLDVKPGVTDPELYAELSTDPRVRFVEGDAESLPFSDESFDEVVATCILHHVVNPEVVLREMRRVVRQGGTIAIALPTDPGVLNRAIKVAITYPQMRRAGVENPRLEYAREHRNHIGALIQQMRHVFQQDNLSVRYYPWRVWSWNINFFVVVTVRRL